MVLILILVMILVKITKEMFLKFLYNSLISKMTLLTIESVDEKSETVDKKMLVYLNVILASDFPYIYNSLS